MKSKRLRPLIGVSACLKDNGRGWVHSVGDKYVQAAIRAVGGLPVVIPAFGAQFEAEQGVIEALDRLLATLDGVLLTGSPSNVEPHHYEGDPSREGTAHDPARDATILPLIRHAIDDGVPLIALCRGAQEVNVALGVVQLAPRAKAEVFADDGQVEAFSVPDAPAFALALQWHPEHRALENPVSTKLFDAFSAACHDRARRRLG